MTDERVELETEEILLQVRDLVDTARQMPLSASVMVNREQIVELLDHALDAFPDELRRARWLLKERDEYLAGARKEADQIIEAGRVRAERMVERTEVVRAARQTAERVVDEAATQARALRHEAEDYVDQKLAAFEVVLERTMTTVRSGRERLQTHTGSAVIDAGEPDEAADAATGAFFDQDGD